MFSIIHFAEIMCIFTKAFVRYVVDTCLCWCNTAFGSCFDYKTPNKYQPLFEFAMFISFKRTGVPPVLRAPGDFITFPIDRTDAIYYNYFTEVWLR